MLFRFLPSDALIDDILGDGDYLMILCWFINDKHCFTLSKASFKSLIDFLLDINIVIEKT